MGRKGKSGLHSQPALTICAISRKYRTAAFASADRPPCFHALRLPLGAPGFIPPCIRHRFRPFTAGDWHSLPERVRARQRGADASRSGSLGSMYGGGFATVPAYLADTFGTRFVGAIHGRLLTAWSTAGVLGPYIVTTMRDSRIEAGIPREQIYQPIYWTLAALLVLAFVLNLFVRPVHSRFHMVEAQTPLPQPKVMIQSDRPVGAPQGRFNLVALLAWAAVILPIAWGVYQTLAKASVLLK